MVDPLVKQIDDLEVDRSARILVSGEAVPEDGSHKRIDSSTGMQKVSLRG